MELTREKAIAYFEEKAPKALREEGIETCEEYVIDVRGEDCHIFIFNQIYFVRYIIPEAMNCLMKRQNLAPVLKGIKMTKKDANYARQYWEEHGAEYKIHIL